MNEAKKSHRLEYVLTIKSVIAVSVYYILLIILGICVAIYVMVNISHIEKDKLIFFTVISSLAVSCMLCSIQYVKRIYKACVDNRVVAPSKEHPYSHYGNVLYFLLRPVFASAFVIVAIFAMFSGFVILTPSVDCLLNDKFLYLCVIVSSFIGFSIGRVLDAFEVTSIKKIDEVLKINNGGKHG